MIDVVFSTNENFAKHVGIALYSLLDNNKSEVFRIHLLGISVSDDSYKEMQTISALFNAEFIKYEISESLFSQFRNPGQYSLATYCRLLTSVLLPNDIKKVLYLDGDIIVNGPIRELWDTDVDNYAAAGVLDTTLSFNIIKEYIGYDYLKEGYYNAGIMLFNLEYWRNNNVEQLFNDFLVKTPARLNDQDAINAVFHGKILQLNPEWNCHVGYFAFPPLVIKEQRKYIKRLWHGAKIVHFTGPLKPWNRDCANPYKPVYLKYKGKTIWKTVPLDGTGNVVKLCIRYLKNKVAKLCSYWY